MDVRWLRIDVHRFLADVDRSRFNADWPWPNHRGARADVDWRWSNVDRLGSDNYWWLFDNYTGWADDHRCRFDVDRCWLDNNVRRLDNYWWWWRALTWTMRVDGSMLWQDVHRCGHLRLHTVFWLMLLDDVQLSFRHNYGSDVNPWRWDVDTWWWNNDLWPGHDHLLVSNVLRFVVLIVVLRVVMMMVVLVMGMGMVMVFRWLRSVLMRRVVLLRWLELLPRLVFLLRFIFRLLHINGLLVILLHILLVFLHHLWWLILVQLIGPGGGEGNQEKN